MATNRYFQPAQAEFINTYVPLPTDELFRVGAAMAGRADQARKELADYTEKHAAFQSPFVLDNADYYNMTLGNVKPLVEKAVANPDLIKTPEFRSMLSSTINNIDYAGLANIRQSRDNALLRQKLDVELASKGQYNPRWHAIDYTGHRTLDPNVGVFDKTTVTPYVSIPDATRKYYSDIESGILPAISDNVFTRYGVDDNVISQVTERHANAFLGTEVGQEHLKDVMRTRRVDQQTASEIIKDEMNKVGQSYVRTDKEVVNPLYMAEYEGRIRESAAINKEKRAAQAEVDKPGGYSYANEKRTSDDIKRESYRMNLKSPLVPENKNVIQATLNQIPGGVSNDVSNTIKNVNSLGEMEYILTELVNSNKIPSSTKSKIIDTYQSQINNEIDAKLLAGDPGLINRLKSNEDDPSRIRTYFGIGEEQKDRNFVVRTNDSSASSGLYGRLNSSDLTGAVVYNNSGDRLVSDISPELWKDQKITSGQSKLLNNIYSSNKGIVKYIMSHAKTVLGSPTGETFSLGTDIMSSPNGKITLPSMKADMEILIPKDELNVIIKNYLKEIGADANTNDVYRIMKGDIGSKTPFITEVPKVQKVPLRSYRSSEEGSDVDQKQMYGNENEMIKMKVALPFLMDYDRSRSVDDKVAKGVIGVSGTAKSQPYSQMVNAAAAYTLESENQMNELY